MSHQYAELSTTTHQHTLCKGILVKRIFYSVHDFVGSHVDHYNPLLCGMSDCNINHLQRIQDSAAQTGINARKY